MRNVCRNHFFSTSAVVGALGLALHLSPGTSAWAQQACPDLAKYPVYALTSDNAIYSINLAAVGPNEPKFNRLLQVGGIDGNLIGIDFRPADGDNTTVYGTTDTGKIYLISLDPTRPGATLVSTLSPRFAGGDQALMDFNPALNALRLIGSNDQNFAVVNANGGNLNQTVPQTPLAYVAGDANAGKDPNITAGAYDTNVPNAPNTTFYMIDYDLDTLVTIAPPRTTGNPGAGSSATGGGRLQTLGPLVDPSGAPLNFAPLAGLDIYTNDGVNAGVAISGQTLYCIDLTDIDPNQPVGTQRKVAATVVATQLAAAGNVPPTGGFIDVAVAPLQQPVVDNADLAVSAVRPSLESNLTVVTVTNQGPDAATGVTLTGSVGSLLANVRLFASQPPIQGASCLSNGASVSCPLGILPSGTSVQISVAGSYQVVVDPDPLPYPRPQPRPSLISAIFNVKSDVSDPHAGNNTVNAIVRAVPVLEF